MMNRTSLIVVVTAAVFVINGIVGPSLLYAGLKPDPQNIKVAEDFARLVADAKYEAAVAYFDQKMTKALPAAQLADVMKGVEMQFGALKSLGSAQAKKLDKLDVILIEATYERGGLRYKVSVDKDHKVGGFFIEPGSGTAAPFKPADYDMPAKYIEKDVEFGQKPWTIKGKLTVPRNKTMAPVVVLVHGSGPHDEDETIGPNKMFRDVAAGLAARGIATLRYQKRTYAHKDELAKAKTITLNEEVIDDALAALTFAAGQKGIDPKKVFLAGHSLGGTLAPLIASQNSTLAGTILLSGSARDPFDIIAEQLDYIARIQGPQQDANKKMAQEVKKAIKRARGSKEKSDEVILGAPVSYWQELGDATTKSLDALPQLKSPLLVLGGGRDYQVTKKDFKIFQDKMTDISTAHFQWFENVNHLFMPGKGKATPAEYEKGNHVDAKVIEALAQWVASH